MIWLFPGPLVFVSSFGEPANSEVFSTTSNEEDTNF